MTDLTKIEKPFMFCTKEEREGLKGLLSTPLALQHLSHDGKWDKLLCWDRDLTMHLTYRQNPDWQQPKLDVPDWFWDAVTSYHYVAMDGNGEVYAYELEPSVITCGPPVWDETVGKGLFQLDKLFTGHNFNPHNIPWDQSLTKRPGLEE